MIKSINVDYVLIDIVKEENTIMKMMLILIKIKAAKNGLKVIACLGETFSKRKRFDKRSNYKSIKYNALWYKRC